MLLDTPPTTAHSNLTLHVCYYSNPPLFHVKLLHFKKSLILSHKPGNSGGFRMFVGQGK